MGCAASRIDEERVRKCKERKKLMKQLVEFRGEFADAQMAYLRALRNTGVTLRQFTESESLELEANPSGLALPPSPPPPLPPSPPPPPTFSPDSRKYYDNEKVEVDLEKILDIDENNVFTPPPPLVSSSSWDFFDPFDHSCLYYPKKSETVDLEEEENWVEANAEFEEDDQEDEIVSTDAIRVIPDKIKAAKLVDDNSSVVSSYIKDATDTAMVGLRSKKTLAGIVRELDDYFLKASAGGKELTVFMDINARDTFLFHNSKENKRKRCNSAKVFSALTWSWSSMSFQPTKGTPEFRGPDEPCMPGAHCITLEKLYVEEQKLYKEVKEEEMTKLEHERKSLLLQKQDGENHDWSKTEKTRVNVETLQSDIICLQQSISRTCSSISRLIDEELHPQLIALTTGLMNVWTTMYECHQAQNHISQQLNVLINQQSMDPTTDYHQRAAAQLKAEVTSWYNNFCKLMKSQRDYVRVFCRWIQLTNCLVDDCQQSGCSSVLFAFCEEWQLALDKLPDKVASEAIKGLLSAIHSIMLHQKEELNLQKKSDRLERKLQRESNSLAELESRLEGGFGIEDSRAGLSPRHPLSVKRAKIDALKKQVDDERAKYLNSVQVTLAMTLNSLKTSLPNAFQALKEFSSAYAKSLQALQSVIAPVDCDDAQRANPVVS